MVNSDYWIDRFTTLESKLNSYGRDAYLEIEPAFELASQQIQAEIDTWFYRIAKNNEISISDAKQLLNKNELAEFKWTVEEYIKFGKINAVDEKWIKELENASAKWHINRLEALQIRTQQSLEVAFGNQLDVIDDLALRTYKESYYRTCFEVQKAFNVGFEVGTINQSALEKLIAKPWLDDGKNFSDRIWTTKSDMVSKLQQQLTKACLLGKGPDEAIKELSAFVDSQCSNAKVMAGRLVMTENAFIATMAQGEAFKGLDVEEYEIVATLDSRTSEVCRELDGKHFPMSEFKAGVTAPPFHPWCRTCTCPYFDDEFSKGGERFSRLADGTVEYVPSDITYGEWYGKYVDGDGGEHEQLDFMGKPQTFENSIFKIKAYEVDNVRDTFTQTNSSDAQNTITLIGKMKNEGVVQGVSKTIVAKDLPGIAAYDHIENYLYINEKITNLKYLEKELLSGYFVAENAEDIIKHEMFHKKHWDYILTKGGDSATIKKSIEADLRKYVVEQQSHYLNYIKDTVCENAYIKYNNEDTLNELIAEVLIQDEKGLCKDGILLKLVRRCVE